MIKQKLTISITKMISITRISLLHMAPKWFDHWTTWAGLTVQDDPEVPRSVHSCDGRREYRNFVHVDFLHLLSGTQPDENCLYTTSPQ